MEVREIGMIIINDTIRLSATGESGEPIRNFLVGFPFQYGSNIDYCFAYDTLNPDTRHTVDLDVGLGKIGFYGINVTFNTPVDISEGESYDFTVIYVFSNLVSQLSPTRFQVDFPLYPSLAQEADTCNVTVTLPSNADYILINQPITFNETIVGTRLVLNHTKSSLESFTDEASILIFNKIDATPLIEVNEIKRKITFDQQGNMFLSDSYHITSKTLGNLSDITIQLPQGAYTTPTAQDVYGDLNIEPHSANTYRIILQEEPTRPALEKNESKRFTVMYQLPWETYVNQQSWSDFKLTFTFLEHFNWTIRKLIVTVTLPEGAEYTNATVSPYNIQKNVFQETVTFVFHNATPFHDLNFDFTYTHLVFWASFRPTLWIGVLAVIVAAIVALWRAPKPAVPTVPVPIKDLQSFVNKYGEKTRILRELELTERQARRGKISRRRYRVRKRALESRLSVLARDLTGLRQKIRTAGPRDADIMRQIEVAETELEGVGTDIRRVETRYRHGEISTEAYRRLLHGYQRRRDRAKTTIDSALLRLREEMR
ncbi:MAG: hypothetical protein JSV12_08720 [Candidatus Bathyarchaeota archaeon]|nr:MAG: hypothetical protein JSV12_08720 [Candidatus Bathyarchaeota archaeon]